jgi:hypothetical protein
MQILLDDVAIFKLLSESGEDHFDHGKIFVSQFSQEDCWHLFLFNPSGKLKGLRLYSIKKSVLGFELEKYLLPELLSLEEGHGYHALKNEALRIAETFIANRSNDHLFFDAH